MRNKTKQSVLLKEFKPSQEKKSVYPSILTRATGFMDEYDFTFNPYGGCSFGCTYCYAAFFSRNKTLQDSWGKWIKVKDNKEPPHNLKRCGGQWIKSEDGDGFPYKMSPKSVDGRRIYMSSVTDPYQPIERKLRLTRYWLEKFAEQKPKLVVQTRSPDVVRDCDLFRKIEENGGRVQVNMTVTTDDEEIRKAFEPFCPSNFVRMDAIKKVRDAGIETCITMTPLLIVSSPHSFADNLLETGVEKFIVQPFHFNKGKFVAQTRGQAVSAVSEKLGCKKSQYKDYYLEHYNEVLKTLKEKLPSLGEGKDGFAPPF